MFKIRGTAATKAEGEERSGRITVSGLEAQNRKEKETVRLADETLEQAR